MRPDLDREWKIRKVRAKALFLSRLSYYHERPIEAINKRKPFFGENEAAIDLISPETWRQLSLQMQKPINDFLQVKKGKISIKIQNQTYVTWMSRSKVAFIETFPNDEAAKASFDLIRLADLVVIDSILYAAQDDVIALTSHALTRMNEATTQNNLIEVTAWQTEMTHFSHYLVLLSFSAYINPCYRDYIFPQKNNIASQADIQRAVSVYNAVENQLATNEKARSYYRLFDQLLDETANALTNNLNTQRYVQLLEQLPLDRSWASIVGYSCLAILLAAVVIASVLLAITSFGIASPLAIVGISIAINHIVGIYATITGVISAGLLCGAIFFATKGEKNAATIRADDYLSHPPQIPAAPVGDLVAPPVAVPPLPIVAGAVAPGPVAVPGVRIGRRASREGLDEGIESEHEEEHEAAGEAPHEARHEAPKM